VRLARQILHSLLILALVMLVAPAAAQTQPYQYGVYPNPAGTMPAPGGTAPIQQPYETQQPVQSPVITNVPGQPQQGRSTNQQQPSGYIQVPGQRPQLVPGQTGLQPQPRQPLVAPGATGFAQQTPAPERNEFQEFIAKSTGQVLPMFGYNLFEGAPSTFAPVENVPVTPDYVIGPGDELLIRAWGQIDIDYRAVVDRNGMINIPRVGSITVAGIRYQDLTKFIRTAVSRNFRNFDLLVTMGQLRSIQVFVVGYAKRPGAYTVSSLSTLVNALFAAGGPSLAGSMRAIQLKRGDKVVTDMDLYDLLLAGDKSKDAKLLPGDVIYIPPIGPLAAVRGSVNNPAIFELKGPTSLGTLMGYAGGLATTAQSKQVTVERIDNRSGRIVQQFDYDAAAAQRPAKDGDLVSVLAILPKFENAVTLRGNVATPLRYPWHAGMRIRDLIPDKDALITPQYYQRKNLAVRTDVDQQGQPIQEVRSSTIVTQGKLAADVRNLADEINWDYAVIERLNKSDLTTSLIPFNLGKAVLENDPTQNLPLNPGDVVTVFSKTDVVAPATRRPVVVQLEGEVTYAGVYQATAGETLRQLVTRVGGVTPRAYLFGAQFTRESTRKSQEERLAQAINQMQQDVQRAAAERARNVTSAEEAAALKPEAEAQKAFLERLRALKPTGRIVLELPEKPTVADLPDIVLEDGDRLFVPQRPSMVSVYGTVFNESSFLYRSDKTVADYLGQAGGPKKEADKSSIYVLRADGSVVSNRESGYIVASLNSLHVMPGDAIVVPEDYTRTTWTKDLKDWTQIFAQFGLGVAALQVIKNY
jgi:polysaccharide export outer membrane protein